jgi:uncharacterized protein YndB with AHSA1/START domain
MTSMEPIRTSVRVRTDQARSFRLFTEEIDSWWPLETHSRAADQLEGEKAERVEFEGRVGGRILEHVSDGSVLSWGDVLVWEPPSRLVLAWKPNASDRPPTELDVRFTPDGDGTVVELEHRGWERLGDAAEESRAGYVTGWEIVLDRFRDGADREAA